MFTAEECLSNLISIGYGITSPSQKRHTVELFKRVPQLCQRIIAPKLSNFRNLRNVVEDPRTAGPVAIFVFSEKSSAHRQIVNDYEYVLSNVAFGQVMALPEAVISKKVVREIASSRTATNQRLLLLAGTFDRIPEKEQRSIARKEIDAAAAQVVDLSLEYGLIDYSVVRFNIPDSNGVRGLRTFRDLKKHGEVQGNCMGDQSVLLQAARGEKLFFEVDVDNRTYSVSMPAGTPWQVDLVESANHCEPPEHHRQRIASMVEAAVLKAVSRRKVA